MSNPVTVAEEAVRTAQRRRVGRVAVFISGAALVVTLWIVAVTIVAPKFEDGPVRVSGLHTETITLTCLSPQQAADIIHPYIRSDGSIYFAPASGISAITVRARPIELAKARELIREFENDPTAACRATATTLSKLQKTLDDLSGPGSPEPTPSPDKAPTSLLGKPGKSLLDKGPPSGSGPVIPPDKATPIKK